MDVLSPVTDNEDPQTLIQRLSIIALAESHAHNFIAANSYLKRAEEICDTHDRAECGEYMRAKGQFEVDRGRYPDAYLQFTSSLASARKYHRRWDEAVALMNLGRVCLAEEQFDRALDWSSDASQMATVLDAQDVLLNTLGNLGWAYYSLGDPDRALSSFREAEQRAVGLGDIDDAIIWLTGTGYVEAALHKVDAANAAYAKALELAKQIENKEEQADIFMDLGLVAIEANLPDKADEYAKSAAEIARQSENLPDLADAMAVHMQAAALRQDTLAAERLLKLVESTPQSQMSLKWASERSLANLYERQGKNTQARSAYRTALATFEIARSELQKDDSQLPFLSNATSIYDDYIHFLITQNKPEEGLLTADQSRARTLAQGFGADLKKPSPQAARLDPQAIARKADATLLFYWLGDKQSYLWAITPAKTSLFTLPSQHVITPLVERYRKSLLGPDDPLQSNDASGRALYDTLVAPAAALIPPDSTVMILADGPLSLLNFDTLLSPGNNAENLPHYWIDDVTLVSAPSLAMLASAKPAQAKNQELLLLGDAVSPGAGYPELPLAPLEMTNIQKHFSETSSKVFSRQHANPASYLNSSPQQYSYIHFVAHGVASRTDPLDSAIILSRTQAGEDSFKLYARDIMQHPIDARLVTISACYGSGTRTYAGEGLVGLSWAFLRAGAHNAIGALWEASDDSTPTLMDTLYQGLESGKTPAVALRQAKLKLLHAHNIFRRPFYWAPFQIYSRL